MLHAIAPYIIGATPSPSGGVKHFIKGCGACPKYIGEMRHPYTHQSPLSKRAIAFYD
jgi:hypothetical protein